MHRLAGRPDTEEHYDEKFTVSSNSSKAIYVRKNGEYASCRKDQEQCMMNVAVALASFNNGIENSEGMWQKRLW